MEEIYPMAPASAKALWFFGGVGGLVLLLGLFLAWIGWSTQHVRFELGEQTLSIRGDVFGRTIPLASLRLGEARRVDFHQDHDLRPSGRTFGTGAPGYAAGWFRLAGGGKALVFLTDWSRAVYVPTREDWVLLVSPQDPEAMLRGLALRARAGGAQSP